METRHSVIQSTMVKVTVLIFCILVMLYFFIAKIYWEKEVLNRQLELLSVATAVEQQIRQYESANEAKAPEEAAEITPLNTLLQDYFHQLSREKPEVILGYYDPVSDTLLSSPGPDAEWADQVFLKEKIAEMSDSRLPRFLSDSGVYDWDGKGIIGVTVPVADKERIIGYSFAVIDSGDIFYSTYLDYSKVFVPTIILWIIVLILIKKYIAKIKDSLDSFAEIVVKDRLEDKNDLEKLPELKPVYEKIRTHLNSLEELNLELEESNEKLLTIMEGISDGFLVLDRNWCFTFINEEARKITGPNAGNLIGKNIWEDTPEFIDAQTSDNLKQAMAENTPLHWQADSPAGDRCFEIHAYPFVHGLSVFIRDITEAKKQEGELLRLERLNLIGQMAAGISHEVRNPMTTVRGFLQMLESRADSEQNKEYMEIMISEIDRANGIITDFLSLAKANAESTKLENINEIIGRIFPMLQADAFHADKDVALSLGDIPPLELNESEIRQLILNLVRNGLEETPVGGKVSISTYLEEEWAVLAIEDEGKGIPQEIQEKMGTPFITTKESGTGLGLAISMGIAQRHQAKFEFETGSDGTTFYIRFPVVNA
jgi:two-component system, sporulation sensor kinase E